MTGGSQTLGTGVTLNVSNLTLGGVPGVTDQLTLGTNLTYGGTFNQLSGSVISVSGGDTLAFNGTSTFAGAVTWAGTLAFTGGTATLNSGAKISKSSGAQRR